MIKKLIIALIFLGLAGVMWLPGVRPPSAEYPSIGGVSPIIASKVTSPPKYALHILFIGNSFTYYHDIPHQLVDIASADTGNPTQFFVKSVTRGGITLKELWDDGKAAEAIRNEHWDYVVLQQVSSWAITAVEATDDYAGRFNKIIRRAGAKPLLYLTWPDKPGSHWYQEKGYGAFHDANNVINKFIYHTYNLAKDIDAITVDVGVYWMYVLAWQPEIELYEGDAHHPNMNGSFLSALVFYKTLTGRDVTKINFHPNSVTSDTAEKLKAIVAQPEQRQ